MFKQIVLCGLFIFLITAPGGFAQESRPHTYRGFPVYPPGRAYSYERNRVSSFTVRLYSQEELSAGVPTDPESVRLRLNEAAAYVENNALSLDWKIIRKNEDAETGARAFIFTKTSDEGAQQVTVSIRPEDSGSISYTFKSLDETPPSNSY